MTTTDLPLPAFLAVPDGDEPLDDYQIDQIAAEAVAIADDGGIDPDAAMVVLLDPEGDELRLTAQRWEVDGEGTAEWALRKLAATEAEADEVRVQASAWVEEIRRWEADRLGPLTARSAFFTDRLTGWLRRLRDADPKVKSKSLPSGTISSRTVGAKVEVVDVDAVVAWAREAGHDDVLKVSVRLTELKAAVVIDAEAGVVRDADTGQPIAGAMVSPGGVSFSVKVGG